MKEVAYYNRQFVDINDPVIPIQERGHQFGDGVYEVVRVYDGKPFLLDEHLVRLKKSAEAIELTLPYSFEQMKGIIEEGLRLSGIENAEVYFQITRGISPRQHHYPEVPAVFSMTVRNARKISDENKRDGISVVILDDVRWANCFIKSLNLLPNIMAKHKAMANGHGEAIFVKDGIITEGSSSNLFVVKDGVIHTHPANKAILHGITRAQVISLAEKRGIPVKEEAFDVNFFLGADEAFITSTSVEMLAIHTINEDTKLSVERPVYRALAEDFTKLR
ncbi:aminotransferase class IV [Evansella sp. AB-rgal1]|uniref:aminotransferase class IV n=1 Tax=Evansella sp. AB-rgal1 TaxID=3242696 RepID=UPI00359EFD96